MTSAFRISVLHPLGQLGPLQLEFGAPPVQRRRGSSQWRAICLLDVERPRYPAETNGEFGRRRCCCWCDIIEPRPEIVRIGATAMPDRRITECCLKSELDYQISSLLPPAKYNLKLKFNAFWHIFQIFFQKNHFIRNCHQLRENIRMVPGGNIF